MALPVACMISAVPRPSAVRTTILARQTYFCGLLRSATTASSLLRSTALNRMFLRSCISQTRTREPGKESSSESKCQICSTRSVAVEGSGSFGVARLIANHLHLAIFESTLEVRVLCSAGIARLQRTRLISNGSRQRIPVIFVAVRHGSVTLSSSMLMMVSASIGALKSCGRKRTP